MNGQAITGGLRDGRRLSFRGDDPTDVYCWRLEQLVTAGYSAAVADVLARRAEVDLHLACDLIARGCNERLAYSILL